MDGEKKKESTGVRTPLPPNFSPPNILHFDLFLPADGPEQPRTGLLARLLAHLLAPLTHLLDPHCSLRSGALLRSFVHSLAGGEVNHL